MGSDESSNLSTGANIIRFLLIGICILFLLLGIVVVAVGAWVIVENEDYSYITGEDFLGGIAVLIAAGVITAIVSLIGIFGSLHKARLLLFIYGLFMILIVIVEIAAAIAVFLYRDIIIGAVRENYLEAVSLYSAVETNTPFNRAVETIQDFLECCGFDNASDWITHNPDVVMTIRSPPGCIVCTTPGDGTCETFTNATLGIAFNTTTRGCGDFTSDLFSLYTYVVAAIGLVFGLFEIAGAVFAFLLCYYITTADKD